MVQPFSSNMFSLAGGDYTGLLVYLRLQLATEFSEVRWFSASDHVHLLAKRDDGPNMFQLMCFTCNQGLSNSELMNSLPLGPQVPILTYIDHVSMYVLALHLHSFPDLRGGSQL